MLAQTYAAKTALCLPFPLPQSLPRPFVRLLCQRVQCCARIVPATEPKCTTLRLNPFVHLPMPVARSLEPTLAARYHRDKHDPPQHTIHAPAIQK